MLRITGGKVYAPANNVNGVVKDICIADGRIVADVEGGRTLDAWRGSAFRPAWQPERNATAEFVNRMFQR